ncbi:protein phosphatase 1, regulatory subunit 3Da [Neoarius graeffei]|uniref:protein phosphatase 1, regulatory subunit 3Da n=1 Tax=Neoarius graeffei TaxID=443677 RepID=UPI00298D0C39|nr:protein phosphatase 1, regulatory subunit 3Da [Neoarius graeffei]
MVLKKKLCCTLDMAYSSTHSQENTSSGESDDELYFVGVSDISKQASSLNLRDKAWPNTKAERKPVKIRPPSPTTSQLRPLGHSFSCEPPPTPIIQRRSQSLPSPSERRRLSRRIGVRFVDSLGMDLENVKVFKSGEDPFVPEHVLFRLLMNAELAANKGLEISLPYLKPVFPEQPGDCSNFLDRLYNQQVCLERVLCYEPGIIGIVQVVNLAFEKEVTIRYSFTNWKSCAESKAYWVANKYLEGHSSGCNCDGFRFHLPVPPFILHPGAVLEFAICYKVQGNQFWDNNEGQNYKLVCQSYNIPVPKECEHSMIHFV